MDLIEISKFISLVLRHKPEVIGISLDEYGWASVHDLIRGVSKKYPITIEILEEIVRSDDKQRYSFNDDKTLIRANQGHSIPVYVAMDIIDPPEFLYHGTGEKYTNSIDAIGLLPKSRLFVHLSGDIETAMKVGKRHGTPVLYQIHSGEMARDGYKFRRSTNGVWQVPFVPAQYLERKVENDNS